MYKTLMNRKVGGPAQNTRSRRCNCCCSSHCQYQFHTLGQPRVYHFSSPDTELLCCELGGVKVDTASQADWEYTDKSEHVDIETDTFTTMIKSLNLELQ